jgi:hypothetical protein
MEDDADWDVNIHDIFEELSVQMSKGELRKQKPTSDEIDNATYGKDSLGMGGDFMSPLLFEEE